MEKEITKNDLMKGLFSGLDTEEKSVTNIENYISDNEVVEIPLDEIRDYGSDTRKHRFKLNEEKVEEIADSIDTIGKILTPCIIRLDPDHRNKYELLAGHHRKAAAIKRGLDSLPCIIVTAEDDVTANAITAITNMQRETLSVMEKAFIYRYEYDLLKSQGKVKDSGKWSVDEIAEGEEQSGRTIQRLIRLTYLIEEFQQMVESKELSKIVGYELSALSESEQYFIYEIINEKELELSVKDAQNIKKLAKDGNLTRESALVMLAAVNEEEQKENKPKEKKFSVSLPKSCENLFPEGTDKDIMTEIVIWLLSNHQDEILERFSEYE